MKLKLSQAIFTLSFLAAACGGPMEQEQEQVINSKELGQTGQLLRKAQAVPGQYIVVFRDGAELAQRGSAAIAQELASQHGGQLLHTYQHALKGFAVRLPEARVQQLLADPRVAYVEEDGVVQATGTQSGATWGIDRIDQASLPLNSTYNYNVDGTGVHAYIVDTGMNTSHTEFTGRVGNGYDAVTSGGSAADCNGHGTHVAGTVGGTTYGVAKKVTLHPVRVLDCAGSGTDSGVIAGVDWVTNNHANPAVANMSLGGGASPSLDTAVSNSIASGVVYAIAAGNDNADACNYSPARVASAITVGATTSTDARASYSNYGTCLDIFGPGSSITSSWYSSNTATNTISGTSMASPHVCGAAALYRGANPTATAQQVRDALVNNATASKVTSPGTGSPNKLLYTGFIGGGSPPPPPPPTGSLQNGGFESGATGWTASTGVIDGSTSGSAPRTGVYKAWLNGYGTTHTDTLSQSFTASGANLCYWLKITTSETTTITAYDTLTVQLKNSAGSVVSTQTYSNLNASTSYSQKCFAISAYSGQTITLAFTGSEDSSLATSFFIDDVTAL